MDLNYTIEIARTSRLNMIEILDGYTEKQINQVNRPFNNNLIWNFAHVIITQQLLTYSLSGAPLPMLVEDVNMFRKGSKPEEYIPMADYERFKKLAMSTLDNFHIDYKNGVFARYKSYTTSYNVTLENIEQAMEFNNAHEALHLGIIQSMRKFVQ